LSIFIKLYYFLVGLFKKPKLKNPQKKKKKKKMGGGKKMGKTNLSYKDGFLLLSNVLLTGD